MPNPMQSFFTKAYPVFYDFYQQANGQHSRLYPGVKEGLEFLKSSGYAVGCVTNKAESFTLPLLEMVGIRDYFTVVVSGDTLAQKKPAPEPLWYAAKQFGIGAEQSLMVGDSMHDVDAARAAGFQVACVTYGYNHGHDIREAKPDAVVDSLVELQRLFIDAA